MKPTVAGYELRELLGEGGSGLVYEARQKSTGRLVALKLLRRNDAGGEQGAVRFRREALALSRLNHEGIARIYRAGSQNGPAGSQAFIAMELVRGARIDRYVAQEKLDLAGRIELILQLCAAVHDAHQHAVIHRDLKPANVLVTRQGRVKVLDFGIARLAFDEGESMGGLDEETLTSSGALLGTLPYMSPEQVGRDSAHLDTRSDVYALGAITYELLSGSAPVDVVGIPLPEAARRITEDEPTKLGRLDPRLRGDLETIAAKALSKDVDRRYASAAELAADLRRYLANEPIRARSPSRSYQLRKFARRNPGLLVGMAATFTALLLGAVVSFSLLRRTTRLLVEATDEADTAGEVLGFLEGVFGSTEPNAREVSLAAVARAATENLDAEFRDRPIVRARLLHVLGHTFSRLELLDEAVPMLEEALALRRAQDNVRALDVADTLQRLGAARMKLSRVEEALRLFEEGYSIRVEQKAGQIALAESLSAVAAAQTGLGLFEESAKAQSEALELLQAVLPPDHPQLLSVRGGIASRFYLEGRLLEAEAIYRELLEAEAPGAELRRITTLNGLGLCLREQQRDLEAIPVFREAVELSEAEYGPVASLTRDVKTNLANQLASLGQYEEPIAIIQAIYDDVVQRFGEDSKLAAITLHELASALHNGPDKELAEEIYLDSIERLTLAHGLEHPLVFQATHNLSLLYYDLGRLEEAENMAREALEGRLRVLGEASALTQDARIDLANALRSLSRFEEAEPLLDATHAVLEHLPSPELTARRLREQYRLLYRDWGRPAELERWQEPLNPPRPSR